MHYFCDGGCNGVSETPGTCGAEDCSKHEEALRECSCEDGGHGKEEKDPVMESGE